MDGGEGAGEKHSAAAASEISQIVRMLELSPHPAEVGCYFKRIETSTVMVTMNPHPAQPSGPTAVHTNIAVSMIYFLIPGNGAVDCWHSLAGSDEIWQHVAGAPLELFDVNPDNLQWIRSLLCTFKISGMPTGGVPCHRIPAGHWMAARCTGEWSLVTCAVAPGFEMDRLRLVMRDSEEGTRLLSSGCPQAEELFLKSTL